MVLQKCYCGSESAYEKCCGMYISGIEKAPTALALMKSRYAAFASHQVDYLLATTHHLQRPLYRREDILDWATSSQWQKLEIVLASHTTVEFKAYYVDALGKEQLHHEFSTFVEENGTWYYVDGHFA